MWLEWDEDKAARNERRHGVTFEAVRIISARQPTPKETQDYEKGI